MANQEQNPPQQEQPFVVAKQVGFNLKDIILNTNNEVAFLYPEHNNKDHFKCSSDFISKCFLRKPFTRSPNIYKEYLAEFWYSAKALENSKVFVSTLTGGINGEVRVNTFRNAIGAHYLPHSSEYVPPPSIDIVRPWFEIIRYGEAIPAKGTLKKSLHPPRWSKEETKGGSSKAPTSSKTGHSKKRKESSSAMDSNPSQPSVSTPVDTGMHKEDQQATSGPTSLRVTSEVRANPQLSSDVSAFNLNEPIYSASFIIHSEFAPGNDASAVSTAEVDPGKSAPSDFTKPNLLVKGWKLSSLNQEQEKGTAPLLDNFKDLESPEDDLVIVVDDSDEDEDDEVHATENVETEDTSVPKPSSPRLLSGKGTITLKTEFSKILSAHDFSSSLPTKIELPGDLKEIPSKLEDFTKTVTSLTLQVVKLKTLQWELPAEFVSLPVQVASVQAKLKTLDALPGLLLNVIKALNKFAQVLDSASSKAGDQSVPSAGQADTMPTEGRRTQTKQPSPSFFKEELKRMLKRKT
ncbi:hypothetical protein Tco_0123162 [Tanacetum coccineum]